MSCWNLILHKEPTPGFKETLQFDMARLPGLPLDLASL